MSQITIKIKSVVIKKQTEKWTISEITTEDGKKLDTFDKVKEGDEVRGEITPNKNPDYNANFKLEKVGGNGGKTYTPKDFTAEKRMCALTNAVALCNAGKITLAQIETCRDKFFNWLNTK